MNNYARKQRRQRKEAAQWRQRRRSLPLVLLLLLSAALCLYPSASARAQQQQQTPPSQQQEIPAQTPPDAQIIVMPDPVSGQWAVATVYPAKVPRAQAEARLKQLLTLTGWKTAGRTEFEDRALERVENPSGMKKPPIMSSVTFQTSSPVVDWQDGTLTVEPFARAFRDLNRVHVTYLLPAGFRFRGLTGYEDKNIDVDFAGGQNAYTYVLTIKNHEMGALNLPRYGTDAASSGAANASRGQGTGGGATALQRILGIVLVALAAIGAGLAAYLIISRPRKSSGGGRSI